MIQRFIKTTVIFLGCALLISCGGEGRVDGEMAFDSDSLMIMADSFMKAGDYGNAMRLYQRAANENPVHIPSRIGLAKTYQEMGASDASINFYDQVLRLDPNNIEAKTGIGQMLITKNRPKDAIPYLKDILKQDPNNYRIYNMLGLAHDLMGEQEEAQMNYGRGLSLAPDNISLLNNLALSLAFEDQYAPSIKLLSKAVNLDYSVTKAQQNLVLVYVLSGEEDAGRGIGSSIMTNEEMENNIRHYHWIKSLNASQRAQAIFLGIKSFPKDEENILPTTLDKAQNKSLTAEDTILDDPKKQKLLEILNEAEIRDDKQDDVAIGDVATADIDLNEDKPENNGENYKPLQKIYRVQLGAFPTVKLANKGWKEVKRDSSDILASYNPLIKLVTLANGKTMFRLFIDGVEERAKARGLCDQLQERKVDCLVLKTTRD
ncbi:MAG: tetratricopeptide repeat protein [Emcibacter sp.]|nr:tetratricopeptide repeat protein [Emcibacter sp.]